MTRYINDSVYNQQVYKHCQTVPFDKGDKVGILERKRKI